MYRTKFFNCYYYILYDKTLVMYLYTTRKINEEKCVSYNNLK